MLSRSVLSGVAFNIAGTKKVVVIWKFAFVSNGATAAGIPSANGALKIPPEADEFVDSKSAQPIRIESLHVANAEIN